MSMALEDHHGAVARDARRAGMPARALLGPLSAWCLPPRAGRSLTTPLFTSRLSRQRRGGAESLPPLIAGSPERYALDRAVRARRGRRARRAGIAVGAVPAEAAAAKA